MKKSYLRVAVMAMFAGAMMTGCGSSKQVAASAAADDEEDVVQKHCPASKFQSDDDWFRATSTGKSMDQQVAERLARSSALEKLGAQIKVQVKDDMDNFFNRTAQNNVENLKLKAQGLTSTSVDVSINKNRIVCEEFTRNKKTGDFTCYIAIEVKADDALKPVHQSLSDDAELRIDFDYQTFKKDVMERRQNSK